MVSVLITHRQTDLSGYADFDSLVKWFRGCEEVLRYVQKMTPMTERQRHRQRGGLLSFAGFRNIVSCRIDGNFEARPTLSFLYNDYRDLWQFWVICFPLAVLPGVGILGRIAKNARDLLRDSPKGKCV